jgi:uncharacterized protein YjbI with pentapeptide repeats
MSFYGEIYDWEKCHIHADGGRVYSTHCKGLRSFGPYDYDLHPDALKDGGSLGTVANPFGDVFSKSVWHSCMDLVPVAEAVAAFAGYKPEQPAPPSRPAGRTDPYNEPESGRADDLVAYAAYIRETKAQGFTDWQHRYFGSLRNLDLRNLDLRGLTLWAKDLQGCKLDGADLTDACLVDCDLSHVSLRGAILSGADLSCAKMDKADLLGVDLSGAVLAGTNLEGARISGACLIGTKIDRADIVVASANLIGARLTGEAVVGHSGNHVTLADGSIVMLRAGGENWVARPTGGWVNPRIAAAAAAIGAQHRVNPYAV